MKKLLLSISCLLAISSASFAKEILPEFYVMSKVFPIMRNAPLFVSGSSTVKGLRIDKKVLDALESMESPFYMKNSKGEILTVRAGDYFTSPITLSSISVSDKKSFESTFKSKDGSVVFNDDEVDLGPVDFTQEDEATNKVDENGEKIQ